MPAAEGDVRAVAVEAVAVEAVAVEAAAAGGAPVTAGVGVAVGVGCVSAAARARASVDRLTRALATPAFPALPAFFSLAVADRVPAVPNAAVVDSRLTPARKRASLPFAARTAVFAVEVTLDASMIRLTD
jgi:hypothetical protein